MDPSGIRLGAPAMTTRGFRETEFRQVAKWITDAVTHRNDSAQLERIGKEVNELCRQFPVPGIA